MFEERKVGFCWFVPSQAWESYQLRDLVPVHISHPLFKPSPFLASNLSQRGFS